MAFVQFSNNIISNLMEFDIVFIKTLLSYVNYSQKYTVSFGKLRQKYAFTIYIIWR